MGNSRPLFSFFLKNRFFIFNSLFHNSCDKFDRQILVLNQINQIESWRKHRCCAGSEKEFVVTKAPNSQPRTWHSILMSRASVTPLSYSGAPFLFLLSHKIIDLRSLFKLWSLSMPRTFPSARPKLQMFSHRNYAVTLGAARNNSNSDTFCYN